MTYTDADVERVAEAIFNETVDYPAWDDLPDAWDSSYGPGKDHYRSIARAALEAMEREPLEDVLRDTRSWLQHLDVELRDDGQFSCAVYGYEVIGTDVLVMDATRYGADPVDAIRNAIAVAQEGR